MALNNGVENCLRWDTTVSSIFDLLHVPVLTICLAFNAFGYYNEANLLAMAYFVVKEGLVEAGHNSIIFDDCFTKKERSDTGELREGIMLCSQLGRVIHSTNTYRSEKISFRHA